MKAMRNPTMYWPAVLVVLVMLTHNAMAVDRVPDGGCTSVLALIAVAGVAMIRRKLR
jgi:hypothetical protein